MSGVRAPPRPLRHVADGSRDGAGPGVGPRTGATIRPFWLPAVAHRVADTARVRSLVRPWGAAATLGSLRPAVRDSATTEHPAMSSVVTESCATKARETTVGRSA